MLGVSRELDMHSEENCRGCTRYESVPTGSLLAN
jgi:hypothetical protein